MCSHGYLSVVAEYLGRSSDVFYHQDLMHNNGPDTNWIVPGSTEMAKSKSLDW